MSIAPKGQDIRFSNESNKEEIFATSCGTLVDSARYPPLSKIIRLSNWICSRQFRTSPERGSWDFVKINRDDGSSGGSHKEYEFNSILHAIYKFFWNDFVIGMWNSVKIEPRMRQERNLFGNSGFMHSTSSSFASSIHTLYYRRALKTMGYSSGESIQEVPVGSMMTFHQNWILPG